MDKAYYVYIMTNKWHTVLYTGMSGPIEKRIEEHKRKIVPSFTERYNVNKSVFVEAFATPTEAAEAERRIKGWTRKKKIALIASLNPEWKDLLQLGDPSLRSALSVTSLRNTEV